MKARPLQKVAIDKSLKALVEYKNTMLVAPTGAGKTFMLSKVTDELLKIIGNKKRVLVIVHRNTINFQNQKAFENICGRKTSLFIANHKSLGGQVIFGMIQTLAGCYKLLPAFDVIVIDEFHHVRASTYESLIEDQRKKNPDLYLFGVTATPNRGDEKNLGKIVNNLSYQIRLKDLIRLGYLVKPKVKAIDLFSREEAHLIGDEKFFKEGSEALIEEIKQVSRKKIVIFTRDKKHLEFLCNALNASGIKSVSVHSEMESSLVNRSYNLFEKGDAQCLVNIDIATEGYDFPPVDCVVLMRKLGNKLMMTQMVGRGLRTIDVRKYPQFFKQDCLVLDFGRNFERLGDLEHEVDLMSDEMQSEIFGSLFPLPRKKPDTEKEKDIIGLIEKEEKIFRLYEFGCRETFSFGDSYIEGICGFNKSLFAIDGKTFYKNGDEIKEVNDEELSKISDEILKDNDSFIQSLKGEPITKFQIDLLINDFDIVGCSRYRASVLINFLLNKEKFYGKINA